MRPRSVTLLDVARAAGVSRATVARVINGDGYVGEETRSRVEAAVQATGYRPNVVARGLRTQRSYTIGHIVLEIGANPFFTHVVRAVEGEALANGYKTFLFNHKGNTADERLAVESFIERRVDAVIFTYAQDAANIALLRAAAMPVVQIERQRTGDTSAVLVDNPAGVRMAMRHLIGLGHRRIAFIGGDPALYPHARIQPRSIEEERLDTYRDCLREAGIDPDPDLVRLGRYIKLGADGSDSEGYRHTRDLLALAERPTALFVGTDMLATGALQALYEARLRVPDDIALVGFDDTLAPHLAPKLTSVAQPMAELGLTAFQLALAAIEDPRSAPRVVTLAPHLVVRQSTAPPSGSTRPADPPAREGEIASRQTV
ncbi:LacI family DNA-binding transcriptional regulator [Prosthecomicrobium pneumaticum]|uniref:LacI family transcriptional regulator n=1 Tax=Prosthecomicrobium pneumaticum TaxID=81895 RepID=A0A7W9FM09_9HYPH|nr:LacI family DNA-binding transcriptional regulator [Prosthecomicrobium pneumaticum]MBB5753145.1 LacI family transcriptional regulator [Prosthecomicrobium pneumaticum]